MSTICTGGEAIIPKGGDTGGLFFPLGGQWEADLDDYLQAAIYLVGLLYCFAGVALSSDVFMAAIERITSVKKRRYDKKLNKYWTVNVWNPTVANLTLMALGSSAPEILLSVVEVLVNKMHSGDLGPSTIVGSAAFNLLVIIAVCVVTIPSTETRKIKELPVFGVTALFSVFAYVWLIVILVFISPDVVEWWEGVLTFLFFPLLCLIAYLADIGYFHRIFSMNWDPDAEKRLCLTPDTSPEELSRMIVQIRQKYGPGADEHMDDLLRFEFSPAPSRAAHRVRAVRQMIAGKKVLLDHFNVMIHKKKRLTQLHDENNVRMASFKLEQAELSYVGFSSSKYMIREEMGKVDVKLQRIDNIDKEAKVRVFTENGSAKEKEDFEKIDQEVTFKAGEEHLIVSIKIVQDNEAEETESFCVRLEEVPGMVEGIEACVGRVGQMLPDRCEVIIFDTDHAGRLKFEQECVNVEESNEPRQVEVKVLRDKGTAGDISVKYRTEDGTAKAERDYEPCEGTLCFESGQASAIFMVTIKPKGRLEGHEHFRVIMCDASPGVEFDAATDGGEESCIMTVNISSNAQHSGMVGKAMHQIAVNRDAFFIGTHTWRGQFVEAIFVGGSPEDARKASVTECVCHVLLLPWKLLCACVPPTNIAGGYATFVCSLMLIGLMTGAIGDLASMLGCALQMKDMITAITIVALGTSLPDTFASRAAALHDLTADASIGNVTGSNSVNVFLGLGLPWMICGIYWEVTGTDVDNPDDAWMARGVSAGWLTKRPNILRDYPGKFVVPAEALGASVGIYTACALTCLLTLVARRVFLGAELGGPFKPKILSALFMFLLWVVYIVASIFVANSQ